MENAAKYSAGRPEELAPPADSEQQGDDGSRAADSQRQEENDSDVEMVSGGAGEDKEKRLKEAREMHVSRALDDMIRFVERPSMKAGYISLFNESLVIQQRASFRRPKYEHQAWRHGWMYDGCADQEPKIGDQCKKNVNNVPPQPDQPVAKMFFEASMAVAKDGDLLLAPNARSAGASKILLKYFEKASHTESLSLVYKEYPGRGKQKLTEVVHAASMKPYGFQPAEARLYYQLTTTTTDAIVQVRDVEEPAKVHLQDKVAILGQDQLMAHEKMLKPTDQTVLLHWEKRQDVYEEIFHHFHLSSITTASCGRIQLIKACLKMGIRCLALYRNAAHLKVLKQDVLSFMYTESETNPECYYYLKRDDLIEQLGLEPDRPDNAMGLGVASSEEDKVDDPMDGLPKDWGA